MSIRNSLLALLAERPAHGYGLKTHFERRTARLWPLNIGQVYTTLARLERDGLVAVKETRAKDRPAWKITAAGRSALSEWFRDPVDESTSRDELAIKVLMALSHSGVDVREICQHQRAAAMTRIQQYTLEKRQRDPNRSLARTLVLDALIIKAEAEIKWLDLCEQRIRAQAT